MIEGLKLTMTGEQLIARLSGRIREHEQDERAHEEEIAGGRSEADHRRRQAVLQNEIGRCQRQIEVLTLIRDHIERHEVYRLGEYDLRFADLLPQEDWLDCGCLDRWRHDGDEDTTQDLRELGAGTVSSAGRRP